MDEKKKAYQTIVGRREGYVVNVNYEKFLYWNVEESSFIILAKGAIKMNVKDEILYLNNQDNSKTIDLRELNNKFDEYECEFIEFDKSSKVIIIKTPLIVSELSLEGLMYVNNLFTADKLLKNFCDNINVNAEIIVPLNNLRLLNDMIQYYTKSIKYVDHIKIDGESFLTIVTHYNPQTHIELDLSLFYNQAMKEKDECKEFVKKCNEEASGELLNESELSTLMNLYSDYSVNPYERVERSNRKNIDADEAYMDMYEKLKSESNKNNK